MATLQTSCLLFILLFNLPKCIFPGGALAPPSDPECHIPCHGERCFWESIYCTWDPRQEDKTHTNGLQYSLHWESAHKDEWPLINGTSSNGIIPRSHYKSHSNLRVWFQAKNGNGSAKSPETVFNTAHIIKPPPPNLRSNQNETEIHWRSICDKLHLSVGQCDVRYRTEGNHVWPEAEKGFYHSYAIENPQLCTTYEFQVRCACEPGLTSDWSAIHTVQGINNTPVGKLDVWRDCGISPANANCVLTWKWHPVSQACGFILGYEIKLSFSNGTMLSVNVSTAEPRNQLMCADTQCCFNSSTEEVTSVSVSAYNTHGGTTPSYLNMQTSGGEENNQTLYLDMNTENLTVSWDQLSQLPENLKEYVVQYKEAGSLPAQSFDWVRVDKNHTTAFFIGQFKNYTPYEVSLFTVSHGGKVHLISSLFGYSLQKAPSRVPTFKVISLGDTHVTLMWEPLPLLQKHGVNLSYQIGGVGQKVYELNALPQYQNRTFQLGDLRPGQKYDVWIRAVNAAGPGEKSTIRFITKEPEHSGILSAILIICPSVICALVFCACCKRNKGCPLFSLCSWDKVPDPNNSHIFREMKPQTNDSMTWICIPLGEPHPNISLLEIVVIQAVASKSPLEKCYGTEGSFGDGSSQVDCQDGQKEDSDTEECEQTDHRCRREAYSKMVDSDEEKWSSSEEEQGVSGYETHFMPTAMEICQVSG